MLVVLIVQVEVLAIVYYVATGLRRGAIILAVALPAFTVLAGLTIGRGKPRKLGSPDAEAVMATIAPMLILVVVFLGAIEVAPTLPFMQLCAEVIPILLLALAVQERVFGVVSLGHGGPAMMRALLLVLLVGGEGVALATIYSGHIRMPFAALGPAALGGALALLCANAVGIDKWAIEQK